MTDLAELRKLNAERWSKAKILKTAFDSVARRLVQATAKARYETVQERTGVPWYVIAVIHEREASQRWNTQLGQGDPLDKVSVHVPAGRGPFHSWEDGAFDALVNCAPHASRNKDWSTGGILTLLEEYNGLGYANRGVPSPYVWAGTDQYHSGKYVRDGVYDPNVVDQQEGCAGLLMAMAELDKSISIGAPEPELEPVQPAPIELNPKLPSPIDPSPKQPFNLFDFIASILSLFKRKTS